MILQCIFNGCKDFKKIGLYDLDIPLWYFFPGDFLDFCIEYFPVIDGT